jgi:hypothetical protein
MSCTHKKWYIENGWSPHDSNKIEALYSSLSFACGAGMEIFIRNEECMVSTYEKNSRDLFQCSTAFTANIDRDSANACRYLL